MGRRDTAVQTTLHRLRTLLDEKFQPGDRLPAEQDLADTLDVSRGTVREALGTLALEGAVTRRWGVGTFVSSAGTKAPLSMSKIVSFRDRIQAAGHTVDLVSASCDTVPAPPPAAQALGLEPRQPIWLVKRLFNVDGVPASYMRDHVPLKIGTDDVDPNPMLDVETDLFTFLGRVARYPALSATTDLEAVLASDHGAEALGVQAGFPLARTLQTVYGYGDVPLAYSVSLHRTDVVRIRITR
ncbi:GntR family transcriptional regulator [Rhizohabitans arisaemae]|uniref:GntR family transcriptional regulator n=1 Tax=Rhizohabitans arisaemae TaxID=2720610 RepID=UPI0024B0F42E|nr:GntR family transcriptional regulator [Rhizohabitans arisaemae]